MRYATILGTIQSTLTNFKYIGREWKRNCDDERLLGVSLTGIMDNPLTNGKKKDLDKLLTKLKNVAIKTNKEWAEKLGIERSAAITCVKPSGNVSKLVDNANVLIMPNLDSAKIAYDLVKVLGEGVSIGPILVGLNHPAHILTPSSTVRRIVNATAISVVDSQIKATESGSLL